MQRDARENSFFVRSDLAKIDVGLAWCVAWSAGKHRRDAETRDLANQINGEPAVLANALSSIQFIERYSRRSNDPVSKTFVDKIPKETRRQTETRGRFKPTPGRLLVI